MAPIAISRLIWDGVYLVPRYMLVFRVRWSYHTRVCHCSPGETVGVEG